MYFYYLKMEINNNNNIDGFWKKRKEERKEIVCREYIMREFLEFLWMSSWKWVLGLKFEVWRNV